MSDNEDNEVDNDGNWGNTPTMDFKSGTITAVFDVIPTLPVLPLHVTTPNLALLNPVLVVAT